MTDNIQKLYEIAGVKPLCQIPDGYCGMKNVYSDFGAEKQLELIKWLVNKETITMQFVGEDYRVLTEFYCSDGCKTFEQALASLALEIWQGLSANQKQEIKEILE